MCNAHYCQDPDIKSSDGYAARPVSATGSDGYSDLVKSRIAQELRAEQTRRALSMSPEERVAAALALGEGAVRDYMANFGVDRAAAVRALRRAGRAGRRPSRCLDEEPDGRPGRGDR
jgi:hypothetical protein